MKDGGGLPLTMAAIPGPLSVSLVINSFLLLSSHEHRHVVAPFITVAGRT